MVIILNLYVNKNHSYYYKLIDTQENQVKVTAAGIKTHINARILGSQILWRIHSAIQNQKAKGSEQCQAPSS